MTSQIAVTLRHSVISLRKTELKATDMSNYIEPEKDGKRVIHKQGCKNLVAPLYECRELSAESDAREALRKGRLQVLSEEAIVELCTLCWPKGADDAR